jgi:hypothetical protein
MFDSTWSYYENIWGYTTLGLMERGLFLNSLLWLHGFRKIIYMGYFIKQVGFGLDILSFLVQDDIFRL